VWQTHHLSPIVKTKILPTLTKISSIAAIFCFTSLFLFIAIQKTLASAPTSKKSHTFIYEGEIKYESVLPEISRTTYIPLSQLAQIYNLSYSFRPISGKASVRAYNKTIEFTINSDKYVISGDTKPRRLKNPVRLFKDKLHIPVEFITSNEFSQFTETETFYYPDNRTFIISVKTNIAPPRFYSYNGENTRIIIETQDDDNPPRPFSKSTGGKITLEYPRGKVLEESISVQDGIVTEIKQYNSRRGRTAFIEIYLTENARTNPSINIKDDGTAEIIVERAQTPITSPLMAISSTETLSTAQNILDSSPLPSGIITSSAPIVPPTSYPETPLDPNFMAAAPKSPDLVQQSGTPPITKPQSTDRNQSQPLLRTPRIKIVLDAGHGGEDPGAIGPNGTLEKDINLAIVKELEKIFSASPDADKFEILLTRTDDIFVPLVDRTNFANEKMADLFISVHCNASMKKTTGGYEVYFLSENASDPDAIATQVLENSVVELEKKPDRKRSKLQELLWSMIVNEFINESSELCHFTTLEIPKRIKVENRGVRQAGFYVLRGAQMPAILVECAFLSNPQEEAKLKASRIQKQIADGLYTAIKNYLKSKGKI